MKHPTSRLAALSRLGLFVTLLLAGFSAISAAPQANYKLSGDGPLPIGGDVNSFEVSADGMVAVYEAGQEVAEVRQLYAVPAAGGATPVLLSALPRSGHDIEEYAISPDKAYVVYSADQDTRDRIELYSVPIGGSESPTKLSGELIEDGDIDDSFGFLISSDGDRVVYRADQNTDEVYELYSVPVAGGAEPARLNGPLPAGGGTYRYEITPDGQDVIYLSDQDTDNVVELYRVPIGGGPAVKLSGALVSGGDVSDFKVSPDSDYIVFLADKSTDDVTEVYSVPADGSAAPVKLNGALAAEGDVGFGSTFYISPNSQRVVYLADQETNDVDELYSVPIGGGTPVKLNGTLPAGGDVDWVWDARISADSSRVVYVAEQVTDSVQELFSVPITGGTPVKLNGPLLGSYLYDFAITPDDSRVVYRAQQDSATRYDLYSVPLTGGVSVKLNNPLPAGGQTSGFKISADSSRVIYTANQGPSSGIEIYRVGLTGGGATKVNGPLAFGGRVSEYALSPDNSRVLYIADVATRYQDELFQAPLPSPGPSVKLNPTLAIGADIWSYDITADSQYALYLADHDRLDRNDLYRVRLDGSDDPVRLSQGLAGDYYIYTMGLTPDGDWALFVVQSTANPQQLYSVPVDGGSPLQLNTTPLPNARVHYFNVSEDSQYVVYRGDQYTTGVWEIFSAPVNGSGSQVRINTPLPAGREVEDFLISPDSARVVYTADQDTDDVIEIYAAPIGGGPPKKLNSPLVANGDVMDNNFQISPDSQWVAYVADQETDDVYELYVVPIDGSAPPVKVNGSLVAGGDVNWFVFNPGGEGLAYYADQLVDEQFDLFYATSPGSSTPFKLNDPFGPDRELYSFNFSPNGQYLVYIIGQIATEEYEIYSILLPDGEPIALSLPGTNLLFEGYTISPNSDFMLFGTYSAASDTSALYNVPLDGSSGPQQITDPAVDGGNVGYFWLSPDGERVIYLAGEYIEGSEEGVFDLYSTAADGRGTAVRLNDPSTGGNNIDYIQISPDGERVVYRADQAIQEVYELYAATLPELPEPDILIFMPMVRR